MKDVIHGVALVPVVVGIKVFRFINKKEMDLDNTIEELIKKYDVEDVIENVEYTTLGLGLQDGTIIGGAFAIPEEPNQKGMLYINVFDIQLDTMQRDFNRLFIALHEIKHAQQYKEGRLTAKLYNEEIEKLGGYTAAYMDIPVEKEANEFAGREITKLTNLKYLLG